MTRFICDSADIVKFFLPTFLSAVYPIFGNVNGLARSLLGAWSLKLADYKTVSSLDINANIRNRAAIGFSVRSYVIS